MRTATFILSVSIASLVVQLGVLRPSMAQEASSSSREIVALRSERSRHIEEPDGSVTAQFYTTPIHYRAYDGAWQPIDTTLRATSRPGFAASSESNVPKVWVPADSGGSIRLEANGLAVEFQPLDTTDAPAGRTGNRAFMYGAWRDTTLLYESEPGRVKETLTLAASTAPTSFSYLMRTEGLTPTWREDNGVVLADRNGRIAFVVESPWMMDAVGSISTDIKVTVIPCVGGWTYTMSLDPAWLAEARYPVTVDPTISLASTAVVLNQSPTVQYAPGVSWYGTGGGTYLAAGMDSWGSTYIYRSLLNFGASNLPANAEVSSASLYVWYDHYSVSSGYMPIEAVRVPTTLSAPNNDVTWNNVNPVWNGQLPNPVASPPVAFSPATPTGYKSFNVRNLVQDWADIRDGSLNILMRTTREAEQGPFDDIMTAYFQTGSNGPVLTVNYTTPTRPSRAWFMSFDHTIDGNRIRNATGMPAIADADGNGRLDAAVPMGTRNGRNFENPACSHNPNAVFLISDLSGFGDYGVNSGWPQPLRDAPMGVTLGDYISGLPGLEVLANNFQDVYTGQWGRSGLYSHLYVWDNGGSSVSPFAPYDLDSFSGLGLGHSNTAAPLWNLDGTGAPEAFFTCLGQTDTGQGVEFGGYLAIIRSDGTEVARTGPNSNNLWVAYDGPNESHFAVPPVFAVPDGGGPSNVHAACLAGLVYAWKPDGTAVPGFHPTPGASTQTNIRFGSTREAIQNAIVAADLDGNGSASEIIAGSGSLSSYWAGQSDGAIYCWNSDGTLRWRYPLMGNMPAVSSGIAVGRLNGPGSAPSVVAANASGEVMALSGSGALLWKYQIPQSVHPAYHSVVVQPLVVDVTGDGVQEVLVGTNNGEVYALKGNPATTAGEVVWKHHTFTAANSTWSGVTELHYEEVRGLAVGNLHGNDPTRATIIISTMENAVVTPNPVGGHIMILDAGPYTWHPHNADWPQFQRNAWRTGFYDPPTGP